MRVATAGLAASESTMPVIISTAIAASIRRSTVHHQLANRVRSTREIMKPLRWRVQQAPALHSPAMVYERLTSDLHGAVELHHRLAERRAAQLEIAVLVVGGAGGREQHHRLLRIRAACVLRGQF